MHNINNSPRNTNDSTISDKPRRSRAETFVSNVSDDTRTSEARTIAARASDARSSDARTSTQNIDRRSDSSIDLRDGSLSTTFTYSSSDQSHARESDGFRQSSEAECGSDNLNLPDASKV